jgi:asparagine synthase (glutamine-hydrolysing)
MVGAAVSGILGVVRFDGNGVDPRTADRMAAAAPYRGPDGTRTWFGDGVVLGRQDSHADRGMPRAPRADLGSSEVVVLADARLDNREELIPTLRRAGLLSPTVEPDDGALIAAAYRRWGADCPGRLVGDFAFALWDPHRRHLLLARDPMAMRGLYYRLEPRRRVVFATEAHQVLAAPGVPAGLHEAAVAAEMAGHLGRPEWSFYEGVAQLAPGWALHVDDGSHRLRRFWDVDPHHRIEHRRREDYADHLRHLLTEAVAARMRDQREVGFLLSGGVDSTSAASAAGWLREREARRLGLQAFSWAFDGLPQCDERHISRHIVDRYGFRATDVPADGAGPLACFPEHAPHPDDPFLGGFQPLIEHSLAAARREGVGVLLGGDRGDLVLGPTGLSYAGMLRDRQWGDLAGELVEHRRLHDEPYPRILRRSLGLTLGRRDPGALIASRLRRVIRGRAPDDGQQPPGPFPPWLAPTVVEANGPKEPVGAVPHTPEGLDAARRRRYQYVFTALHLRGMVWSERTYARFGIGFADPFSDRRLAEFVVAAPQCALSRPWEMEKPLLRSAVRGITPEATRRQAHKIVPQPLFDRDLREHAPAVRELLSAPLVEARGWVDTAALRHHFDAWLSGAPLHASFWHTLAVEYWLRTHWPDGAQPVAASRRRHELGRRE